MHSVERPTCRHVRTSGGPYILGESRSNHPRDRATKCRSPARPGSGTRGGRAPLNCPVLRGAVTAGILQTSYPYTGWALNPNQDDICRPPGSAAAIGVRGSANSDALAYPGFPPRRAALAGGGPLTLIGNIDANGAEGSCYRPVRAHPPGRVVRVCADKSKVEPGDGTDGTGVAIRVLRNRPAAGITEIPSRRACPARVVVKRCWSSQSPTVVV